MEKKSYKLNNYSNRVSNGIFNCQKGEKFCKSMISKLVFYDRNEILDMHYKHLTDVNFDYDNITLEPVEFLEKDEKVEKVIPLESKWIAVIFANKKTKQIIPNKIMYIASDGDGYFSSNVDSALKGIVPEEIYLKYKRNNPNGLLLLDKKYYDGTHDEFLKKMNDAARESLTKDLAMLVDKPDLVLEDLDSIISEGCKKMKEDPEAHEFALFLDFVCLQLGVYEVIKFDKEYAEKQVKKQPDSGE